VTELTARLGTRISEDASLRLRLLVLVRKQPLARVLDDVLVGTLPPADELTDQLKQKGAGADAQH
jgi:hypothetical protein